MLGAIRDPKSSEEWLTFGGRETLVSYGIPSEQALSARRGQVGDMLAYYVPEEHANWIAALPVSARAGPFGLVHAGVRPGVPFAEQADEDLMWIRSEFLQSDVIFDPIIVHGHTPQSEPNLGPGRIGIDTGCFATGVLTAVRLEVGKAPVFLTNRDTPVVKRVAKNRRPQR